MISAMRAASQLPERGPLMWMMPLHLHVNQKSDYDDDDAVHRILRFQGYTNFGMYDVYALKVA